MLGSPRVKVQQKLCQVLIPCCPDSVTLFISQIRSTKTEQVQTCSRLRLNMCKLVSAKKMTSCRYSVIHASLTHSSVVPLGWLRQAFPIIKTALFVSPRQVSHHPPVTACYCDSKNFIFWQGTTWEYFLLIFLCF